MPQQPVIARTDNLHPTIRLFTLLAGEVPEANDIVHLDAAKKVVRTTAADPTPVLGLAQEKAADVIHAGKILVAVFTNDLVLRMDGSRAPALTDINVSYGIVRTSNVWTVDATDTIATRVFVVDVIIDGTKTYGWLVKVLEAHRQSPE